MDLREGAERKLLLARLGFVLGFYLPKNDGVERETERKKNKEVGLLPLYIEVSDIRGWKIKINKLL